MAERKPWQVTGLGCGSHACLFAPPEGQGTNGPCSCFAPGADHRHMKSLRLAFTQTKQAYERAVGDTENPETGRMIL